MTGDYAPRHYRDMAEDNVKTVMHPRMEFKDRRFAAGHF